MPRSWWRRLLPGGAHHARPPHAQCTDPVPPLPLPAAVQQPLQAAPPYALGSLCACPAPGTGELAAAEPGARPAPARAAPPSAAAAPRCAGAAAWAAS